MEGRERNGNGNGVWMRLSLCNGSVEMGLVEGGLYVPVLIWNLNNSHIARCYCCCISSRSSFSRVVVVGLFALNLSLCWGKVVGYSKSMTTEQAHLGSFIYVRPRLFWRWIDGEIGRRSLDQGGKKLPPVQ
jgi:hypothetical protein